MTLGGPENFDFDDVLDSDMATGISEAYTVELEAELNQLKEENARLRKETEELEEERRKKLLEANKGKKRPISTLERQAKILRRTNSWPR